MWSFFKKEPVWKLDEQTHTFLRQIESAAMECDLHIALGGSVLIQGQSKKDMDIYVYPRYSWTNMNRELHNFADYLRDLGITGWHRRTEEEATPYPVKREMYSAYLGDKRIEFFPCVFPEHDLAKY